MANQFARRPSGGHFITMSAGNYGKAFAYALKLYGEKGKVVMPDTAPVSRSVLIQVRELKKFDILESLQVYSVSAASFCRVLVRKLSEFQPPV